VVQPKEREAQMQDAVISSPVASRPTIYLITAYRHNHMDRQVPIDPRFLESQRNYVFYFVDKEGELPGFPRPTVAEVAINPAIQRPGQLHFGEWTFLLTEYKYGFADYPLFMISTRFYEKNKRLRLSLDQLWDDIFGFLATYGYGYLPSYQRDFGFIDYQVYYERSLLGTTLEGVDLINRLYGVNFLEECRFFSDFFCNYIGFQTRQELVCYVEFYLPLINYFFDANYREVRPVSHYMQRLTDVQRVGFRAEKPFTLLMEMISHLYFYANARRFFGLSYDGFYEIDERLGTGSLLKTIPAAPSFHDHLRQAGLAMARLT
jgi:hypothetical protein